MGRAGGENENFCSFVNLVAKDALLGKRTETGSSGVGMDGSCAVFFSFPILTFSGTGMGFFSS